jgi:hypothetical protein
VIGDFDRPQLHLSAQRIRTLDDKDRELVRAAAELDGPGIVYAATPSVYATPFRCPGHRPGAGNRHGAQSRTSFSASLGATKDARKIGKTLFPVHR